MHTKSAYTDRVSIFTNPLLKDISASMLKLDMELTERCNNNCVHCSINLPAKDNHAKDKELSLEKIKEILTEAASLGCVMVRFTGGEPLLRDDFKEIYLFARKLGLIVLLFTNATRIHAELADLFSRIPPLQPIEITLYGSTQETYESVTKNNGSFEAAIRGIHLLKNNGVPFLIKGTFLSHTISEADRFEIWVKSISGTHIPPPSTIVLDLRSRRDSEEKNRLIKKRRLPVHEVLKYLTRNPNRYEKKIRLFFSKFNSKPSDKLFSCQVGAGNLCVDAYGMAQLCLQLRHPDTVYDLNNGSLKDAMLNFMPRILRARAQNPDYINRCARCFLKEFCDQCPAKSWSEHGVLDKPVDYVCDIAHSQAIYLGLLAKNEKAWEIHDGANRLQRFLINVRPQAKASRNDGYPSINTQI